MRWCGLRGTDRLVASHIDSVFSVRSDTPSEGSESAGDEVKKSGGEVKRHRSLKALRLRRPDLSVAGDDDSGLLDRLRNTVGVNSAEKLKKRTDKKKQKDEVSATLDRL